MAQPLIKFFRVAKLTELQATQKVQGGLYFETSTGVLYVFNGTEFEAYSGLKSASFSDQKLVLTPSVGAAVEIDLSGYVDSTEFNKELANYVKKGQTIAGIDLQDNITAEELRNALGLTTAEENVLEGVKVNGTALTIADDKTVDILIAEGTTNGSIAVNGADVAVHGLGSAAYTNADAYDEAGAAAAVQTALVNGETEFADFKAVGDELRALDKDKVADVKVGDNSVVTNGVATLGTAAGKNEGYFVKSEGYVAYSEEEKTKLAGIETGAEVNIIEEVQVNGTALEVSTDGKRAVNIVIPDATVKSVKANDKVLKLEGTELSTELSLVYETQGEGDAAKKYIVLKGINDVEIAKIDASDFIADSFLDDVELDANDNLQFTWKMSDGSTKTDTVNIKKYIDTYTAGNGIDITDKKVSVKVDTASETFLTVGEAGVKLSGVQDAINTAKGDAIAAIAPAIQALDATVTSTDGSKVTVKVTETDGVITAVNVTESDIASAQDLSDLAKVVEDNEHTTAAAVNELNERINNLPTEVGVMSVTKGTDGEFVTTTVGGDAARPTISVAVDYIDGDEAGTKLTTDTYVGEAIAAAVAAKNVDAEGDDLVEASPANNKVTVAATQALKDAVAAANSAVQSVKSEESTLKVTQEGTTVNVELAWQSF